VREEQGLGYARIVHEKILQSVSNLENFPLLGTIEPALIHKKSPPSSKSTFRLHELIDQ